ncbi:PREDICTED: uncharacterized protein LOC105314092 isoform X2 [Amphimedon queenslandica]|uniref:Centriolar and ciliogenesis-associated protein HYLS1 C-terminal domain-containing protein n=1 Tax=Amphimedon queenslandica TaxID=400682 RepID=A0A1X7U0T2_AMPQE|nr:PREDICTED: uncharacterized protein LOC105314092 isoform X2 [Amphimedon queenslandica]|eukprot:XP_019856698.1 PREDICTED: uncharacterized protein LOC105314092 isoform X2 [Amphimedon queenslandica]
MDFAEAQKFVQEQLESMGVRNISRKELESYTIDFLKLLNDKEKERQDNEKDTSLQDHEYSFISSPTPTPVKPLTTSSVTTPTRVTTPTGKFVEVSVNYVEGRPVTRKVLRRPASSGALDSTVNSSLREEGPALSIPPQRQLKSFIRPAFTHPHTRGIRKNDPVQRYHEFRQMWESQKPPGEKKRNSLRWHIKEQMLCQDVLPLYAPVHHNIHRPSSYVVISHR